MKNFLFFIISFFLINSIVVAQQDAQFSQYMFNKTLINPAAAGSEGINASALYRAQWVSVEGSPRSYGVIAETPFGRKRINTSTREEYSDMGLGLNVLTTTFGALNFSRIHGNYSYRITTSESSAIYLGMQAGVIQYNIDPNKLRTHDKEIGRASCRERVCSTV